MAFLSPLEGVFCTSPHGLIGRLVRSLTSTYGPLVGSPYGPLSSFEVASKTRGTILRPLICEMSLKSSPPTVPKEHGTLQLLQLRGGRVHAADAVLRGAAEAGVPGPRDLEALHEAVRQDGRQGAHLLHQPPQAGLPQPCQGRGHGEI